MKKIFTVLLLSFGAFGTFAQAPEKMSYQAVIRNTNNALLTSQNVGIRISILQGSATGAVVYVETQSPTTNNNGLVSIEIGNGTVVSGTFNTIDWSNGPYFVKTETDPAGGTSYTITGTSQLLSVPYALYAKTSGSSAPGPQGAQGIPGTNGTDGTNGTNGQNSLVKSTTEAAGTNCSTGGIKVEYGLDANNNGALDASEVNASLTSYICNGTQGIQGVAGANGTNGVDGATGAAGTPGTNGQNSLSKTTAESAGANCATGGIKVESGLDANSNGTLEAGEVNAAMTRYICNGAQGTQGIQGIAGTNGTNGAAGTPGTNGTNGQNSLSKTTAESAGANCAAGGIKVESGLDANSNGTLDAGEVNAAMTRYICNGAQGTQGIQGIAGTNGTNGAAGTPGTNGTNGQNSLSKTTAESAGANCAAGGIKVEYGLDANSNGTLEAGEVNAAMTRYICNGAQGTAGTNGKNSLSKTTAESAGANCATGGIKVEYGLDANSNGTLDAGEVNAAMTRYICNGAQGTAGTNGTNGSAGTPGTNGTNGQNSLSKTTAESAGANCATGGIKVESGLDANSNGTLDAGEVNAAMTRYICNGAAGPLVSGNAGEILYHNGTTWVTLAAGTAGQTLQSNGTSAPSWKSLQTYYADRDGDGNGDKYSAYSSYSTTAPTGYVSNSTDCNDNNASNTTAAPTTNAVTNRTATTFTATWTSVTGATGYYLDVATNSSFSSFVTGYNNQNMGTATSVALSGLDACTNYYFRVRAVSSCGTSANSNATNSGTWNCQTLSFTGSNQTYTVPAGVTSLNVKLWGARGGYGFDVPGGSGGYVAGTLTVTPGATLTIIAGGAGGDDNNCASATGGGFGGGGGACDEYGVGGLSGGGGRSAIQITAGTDAVTAGGGGGASCIEGHAGGSGGTEGPGSGGGGAKFGYSSCGTGSGTGGNILYHQRRVQREHKHFWYQLRSWQGPDKLVSK